MPARLHPGVYVEEVPSSARAIEAVSTSTAIFIGETERGPLEATRINSRTDFTRTFGGYLRDGTAGGQKLAMAYAMDAFFGNGGTTAYVLRALGAGAGTGRKTITGTPNFQLEASSPGIWSSRVWAVVLPSTTSGRFRIAVVLQELGSTDRKIVENWDKLSTTPGDENYVIDVLNRSLYLRWDMTQPVAVTPATLDTPSPAPISDTSIMALITGGLTALTGGSDSLISTSNYRTSLLPLLDGVLDASIQVLPTLDTTQVSNLDAAGISYAEARPQLDLFFVGDLPRQAGDVSAAVNGAVGAFNGLTAKSTMAAMYWPWVEIPDPVGMGIDPTVMIGPSPFIAGLYARTDARRGVWKAPAGFDASLLGVRQLDYEMLDTHQDELNPIGINAVRTLPAAGIVAWGARTMRPSTEWRYVPVRRTAMFLRKSIYNSIQWAVFEPNDEPLWASLRLTIGSFMEQQFRQGAFAGRTSREGYFVKCDAETTPEADQIAGIVNILVAFAPLRPAEFVVMRLTQLVNQKA